MLNAKTNLVQRSSEEEAARLNEEEAADISGGKRRL